MDALGRYSVQLAILTGALVVTVSISYLARYVQRQRHIAQIKSEHGCQEPTFYPQKDRLGTDLLASRAKAKTDGHLMKLYNDHFRELGQTFKASCYGEVEISTRDPINVKHIFNHSSFGKRPASRWNSLMPFLGDSVLNASPHHKAVRTLLKPAFSKAEGSSYQIRPFVEEFMQCLPKSGTTFDIALPLRNLFLDVASDFVFGQSLNTLPNLEKSTLSSDEVSGKEFLAAFATAGKWIGIRRAAGRLFFRYNWNKEWLGACTTVHKFIDKQVYRTLQKQSNPAQSEKVVILDQLAERIRDPVALRYQALGVFMPAMEATARLVENTLWELARHPHMWKQLRTIALTAKEPLSFEELRSPKFEDVQHVMLETIRHVGPAARLWRTALRDTYLPRGGGDTQEKPIFVAEGTLMAVASYSMNYNPAIWGEDCDKFKPERWKGKELSAYEWIPFSGGPRKCPASTQAMFHASYVVVKLLQRYSAIENRDPVLEYVEKWTIGIENKTGVQIALLD